MTQRGRRAAGVAGVLGLTALSGACVLADPPPTLPITAGGPPVVLTMSVTPQGPIISEWPSDAPGFVVPLTLPPGITAVYYQMFVDYSANAAFDSAGILFAGDGGGGLLTLSIMATAPLTPGCHIVKLVIMPAVNSPPQPDTTAADEAFVTWVYDASGSPTSCAVFDAGSLNDGSLVLESGD